jgi:acetolactate synthase-1/2/3 large subunit
MHLVDRSRTVLTHDSGNPRDQTTPFYETTRPHGYIGWGKSTQLGTGLGLALGAKLAKPDWLSINIMGDASFGMVGMDLETAVRLDIPTLTIVFNNGLMGGYSTYLPIASNKYGIHRVGGNRYAAIAQELGLFAQRVERVAELRPALEQAIRTADGGQAALVEVITREEADVPGYDMQ